MNRETKQAEFTIVPGNCAFFQIPLKHTLLPGRAMRMGFTHDPGSRCDGVSGQFAIQVDANHLKTCFLLNENGPLWLDPNPPTTAHVGKQFRQ